MALITYCHLLLLCLAEAGLTSPQANPEEDLILVTVTPTLSAELQSPPRGSRLLLYLVDAERGPPGEPADGPSPFSPQPVASWDLNGPGVEFDSESGELRARTPDLAYPIPPSDLGGPFRAQVAIDLPSSTLSSDGAGNLVGPVKLIELTPGQREVISLSLDRVRREPPQLERSNIVTIQRPSELLAQVSNEIQSQRAWVVLPNRYHDIAAPRRFWPTIYVVPNHGDGEATAARIADLLSRREVVQIMPQSIWIVLDPTGPKGHHYFIDSPINGAPQRALVEELIPWIDIRFRTVAKPQARLLLGEGAGGRAVLELLAAHPETFGRAWAISPEAITFSQLGALDLYGANNAFSDPQQNLRPATRSPLGPERDRIHSTIRDEVLLTHTISPEGRSGRAWDMWCAAFSARSARSTAARWPFDLETGTIDPATVAEWSTHDLLLRASADPALADTLRSRAWIIGGERDEYYRNRGIMALADALGIDYRADDGQMIQIKPEVTASEASAFGWVEAYELINKYLADHELLD